MMFIHYETCRRGVVVAVGAFALSGCASMPSPQGLSSDREEGAVIAAGTNAHFAHITETKASPAELWRAWTDVDRWGRWDGGLKLATLKSAFAVGAAGEIVPLSGLTSRFFITAVDVGSSFTFETRLPLARLVLTRRLLPGATSGHTRFEHDVSFRGALASFWALIFGPAFRRELPATMARLAAYAERLS